MTERLRDKGEISAPSVSSPLQSGAGFVAFSQKALTTAKRERRYRFVQGSFRVTTLAVSMGLASPVYAETTIVPGGITCSRPGTSGTWTCQVPAAPGVGGHGMATITGIREGSTSSDVDLVQLNSWIANNLGQGSIVAGDTNSRAGAGALSLGMGASATDAGISAGYLAGSSASPGNWGNIAIGDQAGRLVNGQINIAVGAQAGVSVTGADNVALGFASGMGVIGNANFAAGGNSGQRIQGDYNTALGNQAGVDVEGSGNLAIGPLSGTAVKGNMNVALGWLAGSDIVADRSVSIGSEAYGGANGAIAVGSGSIATGVDAVAVGRGARVSGAKSVALGADSVAEAAIGTAGVTIRGRDYVFAGTQPSGTVSVGSVGGERTITNVAAGRISATSTDAINGSQLSATNEALEAVEGTIGQLDEFAVKYDKKDDGTKSNTVTLTGGDPNQPVVLSNVAAGKANSDAVNVSQLNEGIAMTLNNSYGDVRLNCR